MVRRCLALLAVLALWPAVALAQPVFFDDFDGDELLPHWNMFPPPEWEHSVSGGMLHVTDLFRPSTPPASNATIGAFYEPQMDFRMDVWMGWENPTEPWNELVFRVGGAVGGIFTQFGMRHLVGEPPCCRDRRRPCDGAGAATRHTPVHARPHGLAV